MIDINELRRLLTSTDMIVGVNLHANTKPIIREILGRLKAAELERDALRAENERMAEAMESLLIRCDDSDLAMYGTLSTSFVRDTVRIARAALEKSK